MVQQIKENVISLRCMRLMLRFMSQKGIKMRSSQILLEHTLWELFLWHLCFERKIYALLVVV